MHITGVPEREESRKGAEKKFKEIMAENFSNLMKVLIQEADSRS